LGLGGRAGWAFVYLSRAFALCCHIIEPEGCVVWCVVTIDVHPELRGRVGKVDGDVVVSAAIDGRRGRCFGQGVDAPLLSRVKSKNSKL